MNRTGILNYLIMVHKLSHYLEIGVRDPRYNYNKIKAKVKDGIDPDPKSTAPTKMTSDAYFARMDEDFNWRKESRGFHIVFIDGLHVEAQADKDVANAIKHTPPNGIIVLHDCNPKTRWHQRSYDAYTEKSGEWNGTVWRTFAKLRMTREDLFMYTVDTDFGVGIIHKGGRQDMFRLDNDPFNFTTFDKRRASLLRLVTPEKFQKIERAISLGGIGRGPEEINSP